MKNYVNPVAKAARILSHGKVTSLPFKLIGGQYFSVYPRPKDSSDDTYDLLIKCKMVEDEDDNYEEFPVQVGTWSPAAIIEITEADLKNFDFFIGAHNEWNNNDEALPYGTVGVEYR